MKDASIHALTFELSHTVASVEGGATSMKAPKTSWRCVELLVDSGAVDNVGDPRSFPEDSLRASEGSRNGLHYLAANNGKIKNQGEQLLSCLTGDGVPFKLMMQSQGMSPKILRK